ncbi:MAG TPA: cell division protein FtsQ/DivIB [Rhizobacter sp.]|nr:cell division protein FtsQ/DivIB [Rhizobacter sp.]
MRPHAALQPALNTELPGEVRLVNATASLLLLAAALLALTLLLGWLMRQPVFTIRGLRVEGEVTRNSVSTIRANALPQMTGNFFTLDMARAQRAFESVPWVRQAIVRRVWPNRLAVQLEEHHAVALWSEESGDQLVNTQGEVFQANLGDVEDESLPTLQGPEGSSALVLATYRRLTPIFARLGLHMDSLSLTGRGSWRAEFDSGAEIELGRGTDQELTQRSERFVATVTQVIERYQRPLVYADLRHNEGYALRLKGITTTTATPAHAGKN